MPRLNRKRVVHRSTGGMLAAIPAPVDPVGNAPRQLTSKTVAHPSADLKVRGRPLPACACGLRRRRGRGDQKGGEHLLGAFAPERVEAQLSIVSLAVPLM